MKFYYMWIGGELCGIFLSPFLGSIVQGIEQRISNPYISVRVRVEAHKVIAYEPKENGIKSD